MENIIYYSDQIIGETIEWKNKEAKEGFVLTEEKSTEIDIHKIDKIYKHVIKIDGPFIPRNADVVCDFKFIVSEHVQLENLSVELEIGGIKYYTNTYISEIKNGKNEITFPKINAPIPLIHMQYTKVKVRPNFKHEEMYATYLYLPQNQRCYLAGRPSVAFGFNFQFLHRDNSFVKIQSIFKDIDLASRTCTVTPITSESLCMKLYEFMNFPFDKKIKFREIFMIF